MTAQQDLSIVVRYLFGAEDDPEQAFSALDRIAGQLVQAQKDVDKYVRQYNALNEDYDRVAIERHELIDELRNQWVYNHAEHCRWLENGKCPSEPFIGCQWPKPEILIKAEDGWNYLRQIQGWRG